MFEHHIVELADYMKAFSNPLRVAIVIFLRKGEKSVNEIVEQCGASQCYVSQQLNFLSHRKILHRRGDGGRVFYSLKDYRLLSIFASMKDICSPDIKVAERV